MNNFITRSGKLINFQSMLTEPTDEEIWLDDRWEKAIATRDGSFFHTVVNPVFNGVVGNFAFDDWSTDGIYRPYNYKSRYNDDFVMGVQHGRNYNTNERIVYDQCYEYIPPDEEDNIEPELRKASIDCWELPIDKSPDYKAGFIEGISTWYSIKTDKPELMQWLSENFIFNNIIPYQISFDIGNITTIQFVRFPDYKVTKTGKVMSGRQIHLDGSAEYDFFVRG